jgi:hypothetical protein
MEYFEYWHETDENRMLSINRQDADRAMFVNDAQELMYSDDVDELVAELLRLHRVVLEKRTIDLLSRLVPARIAAADTFGL